MTADRKLSQYKCRCLDRMSQEDRRRLLEIALDRLLETEEIGFRMDGDELQKDGDDECFYWKSNGEDLLTEGTDHDRR
jgi:hypothetical protein